MDLLHSWGVELVVHLQTKYNRYEGLFSLASTVADLHTTFFCWFPIWFHLRRDTGLRLICVAVLGDWLNLVLKWVLFGERPYWWVHETRFYGAERAPSLQQFPITCETGPGVLVAEAVSKVKWIYSASMKKYFFVTLFLTSFAVGFYLLLKAVGVDLLWTMEKAQKWCVRAEWVHMDTTPFASLLRNMGTLFGLGLGLHSPLYTETKKQNTSATFKMGCIIVSLFFLQLLDGWTFSSGNHMTFYFLSFSKSVVALLIPTTLVPWALCWMCEKKREDKIL